MKLSEFYYKIWKYLKNSFIYQERIIFVSGFSTAIAQNIVIREIFTIVSGNELTIGLILSLWLVATAIGSVVGGKYFFKNNNILLFFLSFIFVLCITGIRSSRLLFLPGEAISPIYLTILIILFTIPLAFWGGYIFGIISTQKKNGNLVYRSEQFGTLCGLTCFSVGAIALLPNYLLSLSFLLIILTAINGKWWKFFIILIISFFIFSDRLTINFKYPTKINKIIYGLEGEIAFSKVDNDTIVFVNGSLYSTSYSIPLIEQSVHTPFSMHPNPKKALLLNQHGHITEITKYKDVEITCRRLDLLIKDISCVFSTIDNLIKKEKFDIIILATSLPENIASSRYFTKEFFSKIHLLTADSGIFSFTLPIYSEHLSKNQWSIHNIIVSTLKTVFRDVKVLPGEGLTFIASDVSYPFPQKCKVNNSFFDNLILAGLSSERLEEVNKEVQSSKIHTVFHPYLIGVSLENYLEKFTKAKGFLITIGFILLLFLLFLIKPTADNIAVGTTGFCIGIYSVAIMLLYQSINGTLYSHIAILTFALYCGFTVGSFVSKFPNSDLVIGILLGVSLLFLSFLRTQSILFFLLCNFLGGFLSSAQFVTRKTEKIASLNAADCAGGVFGMALSSTFIIPSFGIKIVAMIIITIKILSYLLFSRR
ncbi:MAG: hypothetical protein N2053_07660 [Chitinispirillaceae bacterium]|nr:hypothetical protein [Chitinispirillaceae bacterium]